MALMRGGRPFECRECGRTSDEVRAGVPAPGGACSRCDDAQLDARMEARDLVAEHVGEDDEW